MHRHGPVPQRKVGHGRNYSPVLHAAKALSGPHHARFLQRRLKQARVCGTDEMRLECILSYGQPLQS